MSSLVEGMFSHDIGCQDFTKTTKKVDFYGNDGVCLFKYFVQGKDPQRSFVWSILCINFVCFIFIAISYTIISIFTYKSSKNVSNIRGNNHVLRRNARMNQKISIIIGTDFLCWVPFIIICSLHSLQLLDATPWYALFSMLILPINSVLNPLLYDNLISLTVVRISRKVISLFRNSAVIISWFRQPTIIEERYDNISMKPL